MAKKKQANGQGMTRREWLRWGAYTAGAAIAGVASILIQGHTDREGHTAVAELGPENEQQPYYTQLPPELQQPFARFLEQTPEKQAEIVESVRKQLEGEPLLVMYKAISGQRGARQVTLDGLLQSSHPYERAVGQQEALRQIGDAMSYLYDRRIDAIVVREPKPEIELFSLLDVGLTRQGFLAHESLHRAQQHASPWFPLYQFSYPDFISPEGNFLFDQASAERYSRQFMGRSASVEEACRHFEAQHHEREGIGNELIYPGGKHTISCGRPSFTRKVSISYRHAQRRRV